MEAYGTNTSPKTIRFVRLLPRPIERVWAFVTESEKRSKWLASGTMDLRVGGQVDLFWLHSELDTSKPDATPDPYKNGHKMQAKVTKCEPLFLLGFTWGARAEALSEVVIELSEKDGEVLMVLIRNRLPDRKDLLSISGGWHTHLDVLVEHLNGRTTPVFWPNTLC